MATVITGKDDSGSGGAWADLPVGIYPATLVGVENLGPGQFDPDKERLSLRYELEETDTEGNAIQMFQFMNATLSPRSTLASVVEALGFEWSIGQPFDLEDMVGTRCRLMTGRKERTRNGVTDEIAVIVSVVPLEQPKGKATARPAPAPAAGGSPTCDVEGCSTVVDHYTKKGKALCKEHDAEDL